MAKTKVNKIYLGADHAGFDLKEKLKKYFDKYGVEYEDLSPKLIEGDDYPDIAFLVGKKVVQDKSEESKGVLVCRSGEGIVIAANKIKGIRAVAPYDKYTTKMSREHNDANIIALAGRNMCYWKAKRILRIWLNTGFSGDERHRRRLRKIADFERKG